MLALEHDEAVARSRAALLEEIGDERELTLVRGPGNIGDELIRVGTHQLLGASVFREIDLDELPSSSGDTVLLPGSGAFCRPFHEWMPRALAIAELRFDRVIVLPSSFDPGEDAVRSALQRSRATVFAREPESLRRIEGLCRARLAHDCAFFFDFSRFKQAGEGTLNAFRGDREGTDGELTLDENENDDISLTADGLEDWLAQIQRHALVRTDRAHVMIAAALMGKQVEYAPSAYHKVEALASSSLRGFPVRRIDAPRRPATRLSVSTAADDTRRRLSATAPPLPPLNDPGTGRAQVTAVVLTRDRPELAARAVHSVTAATIPIRVLLLDNGSDPRARPALRALAAEDPRVELRLADRNLGCAGARKLAVELLDTELTLFLDDDAELIEGALEHMLADLLRHPEAAGVTPLVVGPNGDVQHCGGRIALSSETARFSLDGTGSNFDDPELPATGPSDWTPGTASLLRTEALREVELDDGMTAYYEDNDWCYRVQQKRPGSFRRCREARVLHHRDYTTPQVASSPFVARYETLEMLAAQAHFLRVHGVLLDVDLAVTLPELRRSDGHTDVAAARLLLELIAARGVDWTAAEWIGGGLQPLLEPGSGQSAQQREQIDELQTALEARDAQVSQLIAHGDARDAHAGRLTDALHARDARISELDQHLEARAAHIIHLTGEVQARTEQLGEYESQITALHEHVQALSATQARMGEQLVWLHTRNATLTRIEAGGWWRLRSRLLPVLRIGARVRHAIGRSK